MGLSGLAGHQVLAVLFRSCPSLVLPGLAVAWPTGRAEPFDEVSTVGHMGW